MSEQIILTTLTLDEIVEGISSRLQRIGDAGDAKPQELINRAELCKRLAISEPTAIRWERKKKIPFLKIGSSVRYDWQKVLSALGK